jgi:hypothetical protein
LWINLTIEYGYNKYIDPMPLWQDHTLPMFYWHKFFVLQFLLLHRHTMTKNLATMCGARNTAVYKKVASLCGPKAHSSHRKLPSATAVIMHHHHSQFVFNVNQCYTQNIGTFMIFEEYRSALHLFHVCWAQRRLNNNDNNSVTNYFFNTGKKSKCDNTMPYKD